MRPEMFGAQSSHQQVPTLPISGVGAVSEAQYESTSLGDQALQSCVFPMTEPPTPSSFTLPPPTYYVPVSTLSMDASPPAAVTTSATHWQQQQQPQYLTQPLQPSVSRPVAAAGTYGTPAPKPEMTILLPMYLPSSEAGHVVSPTSVEGSPTLVSTPSATSALNPLMNSTNMEIVWHGKFNELFALFPHPWMLQPTSTPVQQATIFNDSAKVRFLCKFCGNAWTSMKGRVYFWIQFNSQQQSGIIYFKLFGQRCQKCMPESFEHSMWYPEEVVKVIQNVFNRVGQLFYGFKTPMISVARRTGRPRTQHNSKLCQACAFNICREGFGAAAVVARA